MAAISSAVAEIYAFSEAIKHAQFLIWRMDDVEHKMKRPIKIYEDNKAMISYQKSTKTNSKLRGIYNLRWAWIKELKDMAKIIAVKVATVATIENIADLLTTLTKCQQRPVIDRFLEMMNIKI